MSFPPKVKAEALVACGRHCCICHRFCGVAIHCHHIIPEGKGGPDTYDNCIPVCLMCHADVGNYNLEHPIGNKYSDEELRLHRDKWYKQLAELGQRHTARQDAANETAAAQQGPNLSDHQAVILAHIAGNYPFYWDEAERATGHNKTRCDYYLVDLQAQGLVQLIMKPWERAYWIVTQKGRKFLVDNNLVD